MASPDSKVVPLYRSRPCPICGKPSVREFHPFSSRRCMEVDLNKWLSGKYAIPAVEAEQEGESEADDGKE
jgi:uncharacterized protein